MAEISRRTRLSQSLLLRIVCGLAVVGGLGWFGYVWSWPRLRWQLIEAPELVAAFKEFNVPAVERIELNKASNYEFSVDCQGLRVDSPVPMSVDNSRIHADSFYMAISSKWFDSTDDGDRIVRGTLLLEEDEIWCANSKREREAIHLILSQRWLLFGDRKIEGELVHGIHDRAVIAEGPNVTITYTSGPKNIQGYVAAKYSSPKWWFFMSLKGLDRRTAEDMIEGLTIAGDITPESDTAPHRFAGRSPHPPSPAMPASGPEAH